MDAVDVGPGKTGALTVIVFLESPFVKTFLLFLRSFLSLCSIVASVDPSILTIVGLLIAFAKGEGRYMENGK